MKYKIKSEEAILNMTQTQAQVICALRETCTWGRIGEIMYELLGWEPGQYVGMLYCKAAFKLKNKKEE